MSFFEACLKNGGKLLVFRMNPVLRGLLAFALVSVVAMLVFNFSLEDWNGTGPLGKANLILIPAILLAACLYEYRVRFDVVTGQVHVERGLLFWLRRDSYDFSRFRGVELKSYPTRSFDFAGKRCLFALVFDGRTLVLDRSLPFTKGRAFAALVKAYFPHNITIFE
jgi:hypothetical protein